MVKCYNAIITEQNGEIVNIVYECNQKDKCCNSKFCRRECKYTNNKDYAIDLSTKEDRQVIETFFYIHGKLEKKIIEYK